MNGSFSANFMNSPEQLTIPTVFNQDARLIQEVLDKVEPDYFSLIFDAGRYEIEQCAGPRCRDVAALKQRLLALDKQNRAVSRRVNDLIVHKHPHYEAELKGVLSLQADNLETLGICRQVRDSLKQSIGLLVVSPLIVLRNSRRRVRLNTVLRVLNQLHSLQRNVERLDSLLLSGHFHAAIELHRKSLVQLERFREYRCIEPIHVKVKAIGIRIDDMLDEQLQLNCEQFDPTSYSTVQDAFELLGSTQTTFAQLQMHFTSAIHRQSFAIVQSYVSSQSDVASGSLAKLNYADLCLQLPADRLHLCITEVCQKWWSILLCYHRSTDWHKQRASSSTELTARPNSPRHSGDPAPDQEDEEVHCAPQLIRSWHEYVACKLVASRGRLWSEITGRLNPLISALSQLAREMSFDHVCAILSTVDLFAKIGVEFCGNTSSELMEALRRSIHEFFKDFHRKHVERLRMFLENETWEPCPVSACFTVLDLQEFRPLSDLLDLDTSCESQCAGNGFKDTECAIRFFEPPFNVHMFAIQENGELSSCVNTSKQRLLPQANGESTDQLDGITPTSSKRKRGPIFATTTLEVLRLIGRYFHMMRLLRPIAAEVMHCICQVFDYYLYSIFALFGPIHLIDSVQLPERLRCNLKRIADRLVTTDDGLPDRFTLPCTKSLFTDKWRDLLQAHFVAVESVFSLADILENVLLPLFSSCLPERKHGLTLVFREQSLTGARQLREACAIRLASQLICMMLASVEQPTSTKSATNSSNTPILSLASSLSKRFPLTSSSTDAVTLPSSNTPPDPASNDRNLLAAHVLRTCWTGKEMATNPSAYVNVIHQSILIPFASSLQAASHRLALPETNKIILWREILSCISDLLLNAFAQVHLCSEQGRGQMLLDVQSIAVFAETVSKVRPFPKLDQVIDYIQAFYIPVHEWDQWLARSGNKYTRAQLTGLALCLARGERRQKQRLLNAVNQMPEQRNTQHLSSTSAAQ